MNRSTLVAILAAVACACTVPRPPDPVDDVVAVEDGTNDVDAGDPVNDGARAVDAAVADHATVAAADASTGMDQFTTEQPDLVHPVAGPDLEPGPDLAPVPACGGFGQPCCDGAKCTAPGLWCLVDGDTCGAQAPRLCMAPMNCGGAGAPCCDDKGRPTPAGSCTAGLRCYAPLSKCIACLP